MRAGKDEGYDVYVVGRHRETGALCGSGRAEARAWPIDCTDLVETSARGHT